MEGCDRTIELKRTEQEFPFQTVFASQQTCEITALPHRFDKTVVKWTEICIVAVSGVSP